jgi:hypothetical protein
MFDVWLDVIRMYTTKRIDVQVGQVWKQATSNLTLATRQNVTTLDATAGVPYVDCHFFVPGGP